MPRFFTRFSAAALAFIFAFSSLQFSAENLIQKFSFSAVYAEEDDDFGAGAEEDVGNPSETPTVNPTDRSFEEENVGGNTRFSTLTETQAELKAKHMRGYQSLYEMQAELFAECVAKLKRWDGALIEPADGWPDGAETDLDKICAEEFTDMNKQGPQRLLLPDATTEQTDG